MRKSKNIVQDTDLSDLTLDDDTGSESHLFTQDLSSIEDGLETGSWESACSISNKDTVISGNAISEHSDEHSDKSANKTIIQMQEKLDSLAKESKENYDKYLRTVAELENFRKRATKERSDLVRYSGENLARDLLEVVDQLQLAVKHQGTGSTQEYMRGIEMVLGRFLSILENHGIKGECGVGLSFDPYKHEALSTMNTSEFAPGTICEEFRQAYFLKDKLLRAAQVVVAGANKEEKEQENESIKSEEPV